MSLLLEMLFVAAVFFGALALCVLVAALCAWVWSSIAGYDE